MKITKNFSKNFSIIDNRVIQSEALDFNAKGLYAYIATLPDDWEFNMERIAHMNNTTLGKVKKAIDDLENIGLLKRNYYLNQDGKKGYRAEYVIYDFDTMKENQDIDNLDIDNTNLENPNLNKSRQNFSTPKNLGVVNNKEINNKEICEVLEGEIIETEDLKVKNEKLNANNALVVNEENGGLVSVNNKNRGMLESKYIDFSLLEASIKQEGELSNTFTRLWGLYPRKINRKAAFESFKKVLKRNGGVYNATMIFYLLKEQVEVWKEEGIKLEYIPHMTTWLNQERFLDLKDSLIDSIKQLEETEKDSMKQLEIKNRLEKMKSICKGKHFISTKGERVWIKNISFLYVGKDYEEVGVLLHISINEEFGGPSNERSIKTSLEHIENLHAKGLLLTNEDKQKQEAEEAKKREEEEKEKQAKQLENIKRMKQMMANKFKM